MPFFLEFAWKDLVRQSRAPLVFLIWIGIPLGIGLLLNLAFAGGGGTVPKVRLLVIDEDQSLVAKLFESAAEHQPAELFHVELVSREAGLERIHRGDGSALLILPEGLTAALFRGEPAKLELFTNPSQSVLPRIAEEALLAFVDLVFYSQRVFGDRMRAFVDEARLNEGELSQETLDEFSDEVAECAEQLDAIFFPPLLELALEAEVPREESDEPKGPGFMELMFPGFLLMALCFMAEGLSTDIWRERDLGTLARMVSTPRGALPLILGKLASGGLLMLLVSIAAGALGAWAYDLDQELMILFAIFSPLAGMSFLVGFMTLHVFVSSQKAGNLLGSLLLFPLLMAGGSFFPLEALPDWLASIGRLTPNGWVLGHLKRVAFADGSLTSLLAPTLTLTAVGCVLTFVTLRRLPRFLGS